MQNNTEDLKIYGRSYAKGIRTEKPCPVCGCKSMLYFAPGTEITIKEEPDKENPDYVWVLTEYIDEPILCCMNCGKEWGIKVKSIKDSPDQILYKEKLPSPKIYMRPISITGRSIKQFTRRIGVKRRLL